MADPATLILVGLGVVVLKKDTPRTPTVAPLPPATAPLTSKTSEIAVSGKEALQNAGLLGAIAAGATAGAALVKSFEGKVFNNSGENYITSRYIAPTIGAIGGGIVAGAAFTAIATGGTVTVLGSVIITGISIPVVGEIVIVAAVVVMIVLSISDAIESTVQNAKKLEYYNQIYNLVGMKEFDAAWALAEKAAKEGFNGLGFIVSREAMKDTQTIRDFNGNTYNVKEILVASYCRSRQLGDQIADACARAMPWHAASFKAAKMMGATDENGALLPLISNTFQSWATDEQLDKLRHKASTLNIGKDSAGNQVMVDPLLLRASCFEDLYPYSSVKEEPEIVMVRGKPVVASATSTALENQLDRKTGER
jgi:hypothetical protein